jgi:hypothetical protein
VGKTALALKLAAELATNFPHAQIYLAMKRMWNGGKISPMLHRELASSLIECGRKALKHLREQIAAPPVRDGIWPSQLAARLRKGQSLAEKPPILDGWPWGWCSALSTAIKAPHKCGP